MSSQKQHRLKQTLHRRLAAIEMQEGIYLKPLQRASTHEEGRIWQSELLSQCSQTESLQLGTGFSGPLQGRLRDSLGAWHQKSAQTNGHCEVLGAFPTPGFTTGVVTSHFLEAVFLFIESLQVSSEVCYLRTAGWSVRDPGKAWEGNLGSQLGRWASLPVGNPKRTERSREAEAIWQEVCQRRVPNLLVDGSPNPRLGNSDLQKWAAALGEAWAGGVSSPSVNCSAPFFRYSRFFCLGSLHLIFSFSHSTHLCVPHGTVLGS